MGISILGVLLYLSSLNCPYCHPVSWLVPSICPVIFVLDEMGSGFLLFLLNMGLIEFTGMESVKEINDDEVKSVIEVMAANGKYWYAIYSAVECFFVVVG